MMEVLTPPIGKTSMCLTPPSIPLTRPPSPPGRARVGGDRAAPRTASCGAGSSWPRARPLGGTAADAGAPRDTVARQLAHVPLGWRPTTLEVTVRRHRCTGCGPVWRQDTIRAARPWAKLSRRGFTGFKTAARPRTSGGTHWSADCRPIAVRSPRGGAEGRPVPTRDRLPELAEQLARSSFPDTSTVGEPPTDGLPSIVAKVTRRIGHTSTPW